MTLAQLKEIQQKGRLKLTATASRMAEDDHVEGTNDEEKNEIIRAELSRTLLKDAAKVETANAVQKIQDRKFTKSPEGVCMGKTEELAFGPASEELWGDVERVILMHYSSPDLDAARALYGSIIAHFI